MFETLPIPAKVAKKIVSCAGIEARAEISVWADDETIATYSTWQLQQLGRAAKTLGNWRDNLIRREELMALTWRLLASRNAVTASPVADQCP